MKFETKSEIIQKRLSIISPLLNLNKEDKRVLIAQIARDQNISERTIYRYLKAYNLQGLEGLCPNYKDTKPYHKRYIRFDELIDYCKSLRKADHHLSIKRIIESAESAYPNCKGILKRSTVQRWLQKDGLDHKSLRVVDELENKKLFLRYRKSNRLDQVQCDFKEFPRGIFIDENGAPCKIYLQICIDNYSKMVLSYSVTTNQKTFVFVECLKSMIKTFGVPKTLLMDNGAAYKNAIITRACECLGIKAKYCKPYAPELKGLIERLNYTLNDIENQLKLMKNVTYKGAIEICRARINEYNSTPHSGLDGKSPKEVFYADDTKLKLVSDEVLDFSFKKLIKRSVAKDGSISYEGKNYIVDTDYVEVGHDVALLTDGTNLEQIISDNKTKPIFLQEIKENVSSSTWKKIYRKPTDDNGDDLRDYGYILKLLREQAKRDGCYINEDLFLEQAKKLLFEQEPVSTTKSAQDEISPLTTLAKFKSKKE